MGKVLEPNILESFSSLISNEQNFSSEDTCPAVLEIAYLLWAPKVYCLFYRSEI
jgi:hypothetical protein